MKNKIIFLDIDGVLNSEYYWKEIKDKSSSLSSIEQDVDRRCVANLKQIIKLTNAKVVVSASMRGKRKFEAFKEYVGREGISIYGVTPNSPGGGINRGAEIRQWLEEHK